MFIRRVQTRRSASKSYFSFRLVENRRHQNAVHQRTLLNLGSHFRVPRDQWPQLCALIQSIRNGQTPLFDPDPKLRSTAQRIADRLSLSSSPDPSNPDLETVHLNSLDHRLVRSVGAERLALHALDCLEFAPALQSLGVSSRDARIASALVVARMLHPASERATHAWLYDSSATLELLGLASSTPVSLTKLYQTGDLLWKHRKQLETSLFRRERSLFNLPATIAFLDLTNVHFHGRPRQDLQHGRSKQNAPYDVMRPPTCKFRNSKGRAGFGGA